MSLFAYIAMPLEEVTLWVVHGVPLNDVIQ